MCVFFNIEFNLKKSLTIFNIFTKMYEDNLEFYLEGKLNYE